MFKVFGHIILASYLLISLTGFTLSRHYCGDELEAIAIDHEATSCCDTGCHQCHTENQFIKLDQDLTAPVHIEKLQIAQIDLMMVPIALFNQSISGNSNNIVFVSESPPGRTGPEIRTFCQTFLL